MIPEPDRRREIALLSALLDGDQITDGEREAFEGKVDAAALDEERRNHRHPNASVPCVPIGSSARGKSAASMFGLDGVDPWDISRDARRYPGPWPVVAHPPCAAFCRLAGLVEARWGKRRGEDGGCFAAALHRVRTFGGVLEQPAWSAAWPMFGLMRPPAFGWQRNADGSWCCEVAQSAYGHPARKLTWLYYVGAGAPPPLNWSRPSGSKVVGHCSRRGDGTIFRRNGERLSKRTASATPIPFRDLLLSIARGARAEAA